MTTDTTEQVVDTTAPDANAAALATATPESSPGAVDTSEKSDATKSGPQKRIDELTWHRRNAERQNRQLQSELAQLREQLAQSARPQAEQRNEPARASKKLADFDYDEEKYQAYLEDAVAEKAAAKAEAKLREKQERERSESSRKDHMAKFREREAKLRGELEDYEDYAYTAPIDSITDLVLAMDEGPRIAYYLGKNPETAARINSLPPNLAAVELGRIDARLAIEREQAKAKPVSKAPPPPPTIEATEPAVSKDPSEMSDAEFAKWRKRQIAQRGNR